jgi:hypothetical protein
MLPDQVHASKRTHDQVREEPKRSKKSEQIVYERFTVKFDVLIGAAKTIVNHSQG